MRQTCLQPKSTCDNKIVFCSCFFLFSPTSRHSVWHSQWFILPERDTQLHNVIFLRLHSGGIRINLRETMQGVCCYSAAAKWCQPPPPVAPVSSPDLAITLRWLVTLEHRGDIGHREVTIRGNCQNPQWNSMISWWYRWEGRDKRALWIFKLQFSSYFFNWPFFLGVQTGHDR